MKRRNNSACHARIMIDCRAHGHHVVHLSSADDMAWLIARVTVNNLKEAGYPVLLDQWQASDDSRGVSNPSRIELADIDDVPFGPCPAESQEP